MPRMVDGPGSDNVTSTTHQIPKVAVSFDAGAFDDVNIRSNGVVMIHWAAVPCPIGLKDPDDTDNHLAHQDCDNGMLYQCQGEVVVNFSANQTSQSQDAIGYIDQSRAYVTLPRFYDSDPSKPVMVSVFDKFYIKGCPVRVIEAERLEAHATRQDRLKYPVIAVQFCVDSSGQQYKENSDFTLKEGHICWKPGKGPFLDPSTNAGMVYSVRYEYIPWYYVAQILHEVRVARIEDPTTGQIKLERMPYQVALDREYVFQKTMNEHNLKGGEPKVNHAILPRDGGFGPR